MVSSRSMPNLFLFNSKSFTNISDGLRWVKVMFHLPSPSSLISPESIRSAMPPDGEIDFGRDVEEEEEEEEEEVGSGDNEEEVLSGTNETTENCKDIIEEPKVGMEFDTSNEAYEYYLSRF
ncbi:hypothetical protein RHGRI_026170 [Rhododendron griersonianum]|uniref:Uncharacterized protein n=1 Tax=Rhododendron griersonianum TaxID=479676 RepID=A0AAV6IVC0_9ERIC|nr:hypothetical protein RHGRI_026170 [Rhododendron griersonianum]